MNTSAEKIIKNILGNKAHFFVFIVLASIFTYINAWFFLAYPYRLFPSDDGYFLSQRAGLSLINSAFFFSLEFFKIAGIIFHNPTYSLLLYGLFSNALVLAVIALIIFTLTKNNLLVILGILLYAVNPWPHNYLFMASYTTIAAAFFMLSIFFAIKSVYAIVENNSFAKASIFSLFSGVFSALYFLSSPSALLVIGIQVLLISFIFPNIRISQRLRLLGYFILPLFTISCSVLALHFHGLKTGPSESIIQHLISNIHTYHYADAFTKFGFVPRPPRLIFIRMLNIYSPVFSVSFVVLSILFCGLFLLKKTYRNAAKFRIFIFIFLLIYIFIFTMDLLPFTKLGRSNFTIFPLTVIFAVLFPAICLPEVYRLRKYQGWAIFLLVLILGIIILLQNVEFCRRMILAKQEAAGFVSRRCRGDNCYVLKNDPHASSIIGSWDSSFGSWGDSNIALALDTGEILQKKYFGLILGPYGKGSGNSVLNHSFFSDFSFEQDSLFSRGEVSYLPYYAYFPSFLFEEEISQALYFLGMVPDYRSKSYMIKFVRFPKSTAAPAGQNHFNLSFIFKALYLNFIYLLFLFSGAALFILSKRVIAEVKYIKQDNLGGWIMKNFKSIWGMFLTTLLAICLIWSSVVITYKVARFLDSATDSINSLNKYREYIKGYLINKGAGNLKEIK